MRNITTLLFVLFSGVGNTLGAPKSSLRLHLPRTVRVRGETLRLGRLAVIRGGDAKLIARVSEVAMGRAPWSREKIVIDRRTILSRLAQVGIRAGTVRITGAEKVVVVRDEEKIEAGRLVRSAESFLKKNRPGPDGCSWRLVRRPKDMTVPAVKDIQIKSRQGKGAPTGYVIVVVAAVSGKRELAVRKIYFKLVYPVRQAVAKKDIAAGEVLSPDNTAVRVVGVNRSPRGDWTSPFGKVAVRAIRAGKVIAPNLMRARKAPVVVRRNKTVQMKIAGPGFTITAVGKALADGRVGELIKVRNIDSRRIVMARVAADGTVQPIYEKR